MTLCLLFLFAGCATVQVTEERDWTQQDEQALADWETVAANQAAAPEAVADEVPLPESVPTDALLEVYVFDLGQADSMLVIGPAPARRTLLIDLGEPSGGMKPAHAGASAEHVVRRIREITGRNGVDTFLLTHYHADHAGFGGNAAAGWGAGIIKVLSDFSIPFVVGDFIHVQDDGSPFMDAGSSGRGVFKTIRSRMTGWQSNGRVVTSEKARFGPTQIDLGAGVTADILAFAGTTPGGSALQRAATAGVNYLTAPANENDLSIALQITAGDFELFTGGDLTGTDDAAVHALSTPRKFNNNGVIRKETFTNVEDHMVDEWVRTSRESDVEVYRANHHGSEFSTTPKLLAALDPELVIYSTGAQYGHPNQRVVKDVQATADQLATTAVVSPSAFVSAGGRVAGEIRIVVARDGRSYTVNGVSHPAFTAAQERNGDDD
ncbi:MAG: MBL fold metallo-hydrolase [Acidobacteriota bacterium]